MPVIVAPADYFLWLDPVVQETGPILGLLRPYPPAAMEALREHTSQQPIAGRCGMCGPRSGLSLVGCPVEIGPGNLSERVLKSPLSLLFGKGGGG